MTATASPLPERDDIVRLVDAFYGKVRRDAMLGPVFDPLVHDWDEHKATLVRFWASVVLGAREYRGNPMAVHRPLPIGDEHFGRGLGLWRLTVDEVLPPAQAGLIYDHAMRIGASLRYGMGLDRSRPKPLKLPILGMDA